jgi:hypothetical protein
MMIPVLAAAQYIITNSGRFDITVATLSPFLRPTPSKALARQLMAALSSAALRYVPAKVKTRLSG